MQLIRQGATAARVELTRSPRRRSRRRSPSASARPSRSALASTAPPCARRSSSAASSRRSSSRPTASSSSRAGRRRGGRTSTARSAGSTPRAPTVALDYAAAVGQRNAALRRVALGVSERDVLAPWTAQVADLGAMLTAARRDVIELLQPGFAERAGELGLPGVSLGYDAEPPTIALLEERLARDIERGTTGAGPHLDEIAIRSGDRDLRTFGSQGEQRLAVLALLLAEAELIAARRRVPPLLLLDDALSELDEGRRRILSERIGAVGQTIVTATGPEALPLAPAQLLRVTPGPGRRSADGAARGIAARGAARRRRAGCRRARGRDARAGRRSWATRSRAPPGRSASPATARCSSRPPRRPGRSSSACSARRSSASSPPRSDRARRRRSASARARCRRRPRRSPRGRRRDAARDRRRDPPAGRGAHGRDERRRAARHDRPSRRREPREDGFRPPFLIHCSDPRKALFAGLFSLREVI